MSLWDRSLLLITSLIVAILSLFIAWAVYFPSLIVTESLQGVQVDIESKITISIAALLFFLLALRLLWVSLRRSQRGAAGVDHVTEIGQVRISIETLESLAKKAAGKIKGIQELSARVHLHLDAGTVRIGFRIVVDGERPFLELTNELQETVKKQMETIAGIEVDDISVNITQTAKSDRSRIRVN